MSRPQKQCYHYVGHSQQSGFTIIELMIATTIFSVVLLLCTFGLAKIGQTYYKGVISSRTQTATRNISDNLIQVIQFGGSYTSPTADGGTFYMCAGRGRYTFKISSGNDSYLTYDEPTSCDTVSNVPIEAGKGRQLLAPGLRLSKLDVTGPNASDKTVTITVKVTAGDKDLFTDDDPINGFCKGGSGSQFCAVSNLETIVSPRIE